MYLATVKLGPEPDDPFASPCEEAYEIVQTVSLTPRDFRDWRLKDCQTWRQGLLALLAKGRIAALRHAVQPRFKGLWHHMLNFSVKPIVSKAYDDMAPG